MYPIQFPDCLATLVLALVTVVGLDAGVVQPIPSTPPEKPSSSEINLITAPQSSNRQSSAISAAPNVKRPTQAEVRTKLSQSQLGVPFVTNAGQHDDRVAYAAETFAGTVFVTKDGHVVYALPASKDEKTETSGWTLVESFRGGKSLPTGGTEAVTRVSRMIGSDSRTWHSDLKTYQEVTLGEVWKGIDVRLAVSGRNVEKIFTVAPGAEPSSIRMEMAGAHRLKLGGDGALIAETGLGPVSFSAPIAYQEIDSKRRPVQVAYALNSSGYGFEVGDYEHSYPLIIDPILQSTYLGGSTGPGGFQDRISGIAIHPTTGEVYVVGRTGTSNFPGTAGGAQSTYTTGFTFVARLNASLTSLLQATYYGSSLGGAASQSFVIKVTETDVYIAGRASGVELPGSAGGAITATTNSAPGFVARFSSSLTSVTQATYITSASSGVTDVYDMVVHPNGDVYILGNTNVAALPNTTGAFQPGLNGANDGFIMRLNGALTAIARSSYLGGSSTEEVFNLGVSASTGDLYVGGWTSSLAGFPGVSGGAQSTTSGIGSSGFVSRINADLTALLQSTYVDGAGSDDSVRGLAVHPQNGDIYITGYGSSGLPAIAGGAQTAVSQVFVSRLNAALTAFVQSTFFGTTEQFFDDANRIHPIFVHPVSGEIYLIGITLSTTLPGASGGAQTTRSGALDGFVARFNAGLTQILQSTYLGGSTNSDFPYAITVHPGTGDIYVAGETQSIDFPGTVNGAQPSRNGSADGFISRLTSNLAAQTVVVDFDGDGRSDIAVYRSGLWIILRSSDGGVTATQFGGGTDVPVPGDYDRDGMTDITVYRSGLWIILRSSDGGVTATQFGGGTDVPLPADYDGDGKADIAVYRNGLWIILRSSDGGVTATQFGGGTDVPMPADYDGDGKADIAVYRNGLWIILRSSDGGVTATWFGGGTDVPVPADYDGDGKTDIAVYRSGLWIYSPSSGGANVAVQFGGGTDIPMPADYDGDGETDIAVYRSGLWIYQPSSGGANVATQFGGGTDVPLN